MENIIAQYGSPFIAAILIGLGCGFSCGSTSTIFLTTYIMGNENDTKKGFFSVMHFLSGKIIVMIILGIISSFMGTAIINEYTTIGGFNSKILLNIVEIVTGIAIFYKIFKKKSCCNKKSCGKNFINNKKENIIKHIPLWLAGMAYGMTPCYPLAVMLLFSATLSPLNACFLMLVFGISNSISPVIIYGTMAGYFSKKMYKEIPQYIHLIQGMAGAVFILIGVYPLIIK
ncbi:sulfite exporter TauE/SafE family protein [Tepidibacter hydrothermalis]|uniref:Sulfite exporter TauE/SafE family protein n=1 Tax=Tepidibacter hydrothermalis TaxID=3036126 RepID=A0ABY8EDW0_9FIRM|nr:sulfite exporter TauE/SafE family protein [Tepidibacter hydrothermalis]WFD10075.1 sulfite exporter TauE/SafE family protein [Tepidibacter hydrothermalis]